jgi:hypothetical protein
MDKTILDNYESLVIPILRLYNCPPAASVYIRSILLEAAVEQGILTAEEHAKAREALWTING